MDKYRQNMAILIQTQLARLHCKLDFFSKIRVLLGLENQQTNIGFFSLKLGHDILPV